MSSAKQMLKSSFNYTVVQYLVLAIGFVKGIYVARALTPAILGSYGLIVLVLDYLRYAQLGIFSAMNLESSIHMGQGEKKAYVQEITNSAFGYLILIGGLFFGTAWIVKAFFGFLVAEDLLPYLYAVALIGFAEQVKSFLIIYARLHEKYYLINRIELWSNVLLVLVIILFVSRFKLNAVIGAMIAASLLSLIFCFVIMKRRVQIVLRPAMIKRLLVIGTPLLIYGLSERLFSTIDRLIIANFMSREALGFFTLSNSILSSTMVLLGSFAFLYYPRVLNKFNVSHRGEGEKENLRNGLKKYSQLLASAAIVIGMTGIVLIDPFVRILLPRYETSIFLYQILMLGVIGDGLTYFASSFLISNKKQFQLIALIGFVAVVNILLNVLVLRRGWGLSGIAMATAISMMLYAGGKVVLAFRALGGVSVAVLFDFFKKYLVLAAVLFPVIVWAPGYVYLGVPVIFALYFREFAEILKRFKVEFVPG